MIAELTMTRHDTEVERHRYTRDMDAWDAYDRALLSHRGCEVTLRINGTVVASAAPVGEAA